MNCTICVFTNCEIVNRNVLVVSLTISISIYWETLAFIKWHFHDSWTGSILARYCDAHSKRENHREKIFLYSPPPPPRRRARGALLPGKNCTTAIGAFNVAGFFSFFPYDRWYGWHYFRHSPTLPSLTTIIRFIEKGMSLCHIRRNCTLTRYSSHYFNAKTTRRFPVSLSR